VRNCFVLSNSVVEHLGDDPVATLLGSDVEMLAEPFDPYR